MVVRILTFCAAFLSGLAVLIGINVIKAINPFLPWEYPVLRFFIGMTFPGGAPHSLHYLSLVAETWIPFLAAFLVAYVLTKRRARFYGAIAIYLAFLAWGAGMVLLVGEGMSIHVAQNLGLAGTFLGGLYLYLWLVSPVPSA